jgi:hypothetical protein
MLTLIQPWFNSPNPVRARELLFCLKKNLEHPLIGKVILLSEHTPPIEHEKLYMALIKRRASFYEAINLTDGLVVVANTDIYFDETLELALNIKEKECYALSRYDIIKGEKKLYARCDSQDAWIFNNPKLKVGNYQFGMPGCDNRLAYEINQSGYKIYNPCLDIHAIHEHKSNIRTYTERNRLKGKYLQLHPSKL